MYALLLASKLWVSGGGDRWRNRVSGDLRGVLLVSLRICSAAILPLLASSDRIGYRAAYRGSSHYRNGGIFRNYDSRPSGMPRAPTVLSEAVIRAY